MSYKEEFLDTFSQILDEEVESLDTLLESYDNWDSVNALRIIKHLETTYSKSLPVRSFLEAKKVSDIYDIVFSDK